MRRPKHPNKTIEEAIQYADSKGWHYLKSGNSSHAWGNAIKLSYLGVQTLVWASAHPR